MKKILLVGVLFTTILSGCGEKSNSMSVPSERNKLVIRLFQSLEREEHSAAVAQARKLLTLNEGNAYLDLVISRQLDNQLLIGVQEQLNRGEFDHVVESLSKRQADTPLSSSIRSKLEQAQLTSKINSAIDRYLNAKSLDERNVALRNLEKVVEKSNFVELQNSISQKRKKLDLEILEAKKQEEATKES